MSTARKTGASRKKAEQDREKARNESASAPAPVAKVQGSTRSKSKRSEATPKQASPSGRTAPKADEAGAAPKTEKKQDEPPTEPRASRSWKESLLSRLPQAPTWLSGLLKHRPSGLEMLVGVLIIVAAIMVGMQLFGGQPRRQPTPAVLSRSDVRQVPPGLIRILNNLERNAQVDRRTVSRLETRLDRIRIQLDTIHNQIKSRLKASSPPAGSPRTATPTASPARPEPPPAVPPSASGSSAAPNRRLIDLEIKLDELARRIKSLEKRLGRSGRPR